MVESITAPSPAPSRGLTSSVVYDLLDDSDVFLPITPRRPRIGINGSGVLPSPGSLESMLKTTTETGDIGFFSIAPKSYRPPTHRHNRRELSLIEAIGDLDHPLVSTDSTCDEPPRPYSTVPESFRPYSRASSYASRQTSTTMGYDRGYSPAPSHFNTLRTVTPRNPSSGYPAPRRPRTRPRHNEPPSSRPMSPDKSRATSQPIPALHGQKMEKHPPRGQTPHIHHRHPHISASRHTQLPSMYPVPHQRHMSAQCLYKSHQRYDAGYGQNTRVEGYNAHGRRIVTTGSWYGQPPAMHNSYSGMPLPEPHDGMGYWAPPPSRGDTPVGSPQRGPTPLGSPRRGSIRSPTHVSREPALIYNDVFPEDTTKAEEKAPHHGNYMLPSGPLYQSSRAPMGFSSPGPPYPKRRHSRYDHGRHNTHYSAHGYPAEGPISQRHVSYPGHEHVQHHGGGYGHRDGCRTPGNAAYDDVAPQPVSVDESSVTESPSSGFAASNEESDSPSDSDNSTFSAAGKTASSISPISTIAVPEDRPNEAGVTRSRPPSRACTSALTMRGKEVYTPRPRTRTGQTPSPTKMKRDEDVDKRGKGKLQKRVVIHDEAKPGFWSRVTNKVLGRKRSSSMMSNSSMVVG